MGHTLKLIAAIGLVLSASGFAALIAQPQSASALSGCTQYGTVNITASNGWSSSQPYYQQLRNGSRGECVKSLQRMINVFCTSETDLAVDGVYGSKTYHAVKTIQYIVGKHWDAHPRVNGAVIVEDGIAGKQTWGMLQAFSYWNGNLQCTYR